MHVLTGGSYKASGQLQLAAPVANASIGPVAVVSVPSQVRCKQSCLYESGSRGIVLPAAMAGLAAMACCLLSESNAGRMHMAR